MALGVDTFDVTPFTRELGGPGARGVRGSPLWSTPTRPVALVVGEGFALGRGRSGNVARLREIGSTRGFEVEAVPLVIVLTGRRVSSTRIRAALAEGNVAEAARFLGRRYALRGTVVIGDGRGRELGFPDRRTCVLHGGRAVPADGIYAVQARVGDEPALRPAAMSIGMRPTFDGQLRTLEVHLVDWSGDLVGPPAGGGARGLAASRAALRSAQALIGGDGPRRPETRQEARRDGRAGIGDARAALLASLPRRRGDVDR